MDSFWQSELGDSRWHWVPADKCLRQRLEPHFMRGSLWVAVAGHQGIAIAPAGEIVAQFAIVHERNLIAQRQGLQVARVGSVATFVLEHAKQKLRVGVMPLNPAYASFQRCNFIGSVSFFIGARAKNHQVWPRAAGASEQFWVQGLPVTAGFIAIVPWLWSNA